MQWLENIRFFSGALGFGHTVIACTAIVLGTVVLFKPKGSKMHRRIGYAYVWSMVLTNLSAFLIYNTGRPSFFHLCALISLLTLTAGVIAAVRKRKGWLVRHYYFMSWSVVGLYCAFWSETGTRLVDMQYFWWTVMAATMITAAVGAMVIQSKAKSLMT